MPNKRVSFNQKHEVTTASSDNTDDLFRKTFDTTEIQNNNKELRRQTYYLDEDIIEAIREMAYHTRKDKSELVRDLLKNSALNKYIP
jgi:hypothetical protein